MIICQRVNRVCKQSTTETRDNMYLNPRDNKLRWLDKMSIRETLEKMTKAELSKLDYEGKVFFISEKEMKRIHKDTLVKYAEKIIIEYWENRLKKSDKPYERRIMKQIDENNYCAAKINI